MDKLSHLIVEAMGNNKWNPMKTGRNGPTISHLMFADDLVLFGEANMDQLEVMMGCLKDFCDISVHLVSIEKTTIYFSRNTSHMIKEEITRASGFSVANSMGKYLGSMLYHGRGKMRNFAGVLERVKSPLSNWKNNLLSFAGRLGEWSIIRKLSGLRFCLENMQGTWILEDKSKIQPYDSALWKGLGRIWNGFLDNLQWDVDNGKDTYLWQDRWTNLKKPLCDYVLPNQMATDFEAKVVDMVNLITGDWLLENISDIFSLKAVNSIRATLPPSIERGDDGLV
ncbi:uncharacterized protein LOC133292706 [Gastrolobium bilobum]|uniref:uncharacterized protein LOC133292706 n=1 Tax=Gastrolobium bilobum TaxID=150636 RepID=UPI002AB1360F|nr:uncharacterized protein LOC133292706 [Gastrolobium bilobum]